MFQLPKKILIPMVGLLSIASIGSLAYTQYSSGNPKLSINSSSITAQSQSSVTVSSALDGNQVKESSQSLSQDSPKCNLPQSERLVQTNVGCFEGSLNRIFTFSQNIGDPNDGVGPADNPPYSKELEDYYIQNLGADLYSRVQPESQTPGIVISVGGSTKVADGVFEVYAYSPDIDFLVETKQDQSDVPRFGAVYTVQLGAKRSFKLKSFNFRKKCTLPPSDNLVKTGYGCFNFSVGGRITGTNTISDAEFNNLKIHFKQAAINYYSIVNSKFLSSQHSINANYTKKINDTNFEVLIGMVDDEYYRKKYGDAPGDYGEINVAKYSISKNLTSDTWSFEFINYENSK